MKKSVFLLVAIALALTSCGLKVPLTVQAGAQGQDGLVDNAQGQIGTDTGPGSDLPGATGPNASATTGPGVPGAQGGVAGTIFPRETEGVTKNSITLCGHVPISGAAPIPHHPNRFGQFYFDYVNQELGGIYGRSVTFRAINDFYNPAGARNAVEQCSKQGAFFYVGAAGTDQIVSVAKWAERKQVPYLHGPTSDKDLGGLKYNVFAGPTYEHQHRLLAQYLVKRFGKDKKFITIKVDSPYFDAGADAFRDEMKRLGVTMPADIKVQKDESQFASVYDKLNRELGIDVINNFSTPNIWIKLLAQKPPTYNPTWSAVSPVAGFNIVAQALSEARAKATVLHSFGPACECATYKDEEISHHKNLRWYSDIKEFLRIFKKYSPEQDPPPDDFDYASYITAKAFHRLLLKLGQNPTRSALWQLFTTYKEDPAKTFPGCAGDFTRNKLRMGAWNVNVFDLIESNAPATRGALVWKQIQSCIDSA